MAWYMCRDLVPRFYTPVLCDLHLILDTGKSIQYQVRCRNRVETCYVTLLSHQMMVVVVVAADFSIYVGESQYPEPFCREPWVLLGENNKLRRGTGLAAFRRKSIASVCRQKRNRVIAISGKCSANESSSTLTTSYDTAPGS